MSGQNITFRYQGKKYEVDIRAYNDGLEYIVLPNGIVLQTDGWLESMPPKPDGLQEVLHLYAHEPVERIAELLNGIVAKEIS